MLIDSSIVGFNFYIKSMVLNSNCKLNTLYTFTLIYVNPNG